MGLTVIGICRYQSCSYDRFSLYSRSAIQRPEKRGISPERFKRHDGLREFQRDVQHEAVLVQGVEGSPAAGAVDDARSAVDGHGEALAHVHAVALRELVVG